MTIEAISADDAPDAIGPYSHAVRAGNTLYLSGQIALDPTSDTMELIADDIRTETKQVLRNIASVLAAAGSDLKHLVKLTVYLTDLTQFDQVNAVMSEMLTFPFPARAAVGIAALPLGATIEMDAIAVLDN